MNLQKIIDLAIENGGASYSIVSGDYNPNKGYMVSYVGCETITSVLTLDILVKYIKHYIDYLSTSDVYVGIWLNDGNWYLDISENVSDKDEAIKVARLRKQIAIWDCENNKEIRLD